MDTKKFWMASAAASAIFWAGSALWYSGVMRRFYTSQARRGVKRRHPLYPVDVLSRAIYGMWFAYEFPRAMRRDGHAPVKDGARYGAWAGSLQAVPASLVQFANTRVGLPATLASGMFETALGAVAGMAVGAIYGKDYHSNGTETLPVEDEETSYPALGRP
ncbi:MAG TPA: hypothetical protein VGL38_04940 [bacterium]|jgi:hypothetical protein